MSKTQGERWMQILGAINGFQVSDLGRVRFSGKREGVRVGIKKTGKNTQGYLGVNIVDHDNTNKRISLHHAVADAFLPKMRGDNSHVLFKNGDKSDCRAINLKRGSRTFTTSTKEELVNQLEMLGYKVELSR